MVLVLCFIGGYPIQYLLGIVCSGVVFFVLFFMTARAYPEAMPNRVDTCLLYTSPRPRDLSTSRMPSSG